METRAFQPATASALAAQVTLPPIHYYLANALLLASLQAKRGQAKELISDRPHMMVVAANPLAAAAGFEILKAGGTAVDAAIAVQAVLGLVDGFRQRDGLAIGQ